jgi:hypothetical protein
MSLVESTPASNPSPVPAEGEAGAADRIIQQTVAPELIAAEPPETPEAEQGSSLLDTVSRRIKQGVIAAEASPFINEPARFAMFAGLAAGEGPVKGALVLGGSTLLFEGAGALAASSVLTDKTDHKIVNWLQRKITNTTTGHLISKNTMNSAKAAVAYNMGTPALLTVEQGIEPDRPASEVRRKGLLTAAVLSGILAVEGAAINEGMDMTGGSTAEKLGTGAAIAATLMAVPYVYNRIRSHFQEDLPLTEKLGEVTGTVGGFEKGTDRELTPSALKRLANLYETYRNEHDEAVKIGLYGDDLKAAFENPKSILFEYTQPSGIKTFMPLLVPAEDLEWYNMDLLKRSHGEDKQFYYYAHPPLPEGDVSRANIQKALKDAMDKGAVIFTDEYEGADESILTRLAADGEYAIGDIGWDDKERNGQVFTTEVSFEGVEDIRKAPTLQEVYEKMVANGEITEELENGVALHDVITGEDAEKIWQIYDNPFAKLTEEHPMHAGFDKEQLLAFMADPKIAKIVNRTDGEITTMVFFQQDFEASEWFNTKYYEENFPEYYKTGNIFIFPGIVTDETKRNQSYALDVINLAGQLMAKRGTNCLVTFECTEISATYIPKIVSYAITHNRNVSAKATPVKEPISKTVYRSIKKA